MKAKPFIIVLVVVLAGGLGIYALVKSHETTEAAGGDEAPTDTIVSVQTGTLQRLTLHHYVTGYGTVEPAPATADESAAGAQLAATTAGVVSKVNVVEGQHVNQGEVLVELNSGTASFASAKAELERQQQLFAQHNSSLKNLQDAETQLASLQVVAPLAGTVTRLNVKPGAAVDVSTVVAEVMDLNRLAVSAGIPAASAGELKTGDEVQVLTEPSVAATLAYVSPAVDANTGTVLARTLLPKDSGLRPGQFVPLQIVTAVHTNCLTAPDESVVTDINGQSVIALVNGDEATQTSVQTGFRENGRVEVAGTGLKEGDTVVTTGAYGLPEKTKIQLMDASAEATPATNSSSAQ